jgi:1-deoxy-D-xylulose-5-phosphate reductoisomerase
MKIPILNSMKLNELLILKTKKINFKKLNNLNFQKVVYSKFPLDKILNLIKDKTFLFDTVLVATNDKLVELFLTNKIKFTDIHKQLIKIINLKQFKIYKKLAPKTLSDIIEVNDLVNNFINKKFNN